MKYFVAIAVAILALTTSVRAAAVDGKWTGMIDSPNGPVQISFTFQADGNTLTGSTTGPDGNIVQIKNGKIDGDKISFTVDLDFGGMPFTLAYAGVVMSDQIKLMIDFMGMPIDLVVKKAN
jgi:hypothetical protein